MKKAAVVSQGGLFRTICDSSALAALSLVALEFEAGAIDPKQNPKLDSAMFRIRGAHRLMCWMDDQHDLRKVNADVLFVKVFLSRFDFSGGPVENCDRCAWQR
jgi:hypothetical protein